MSDEVNPNFRVFKAITFSLYDVALTFDQAIPLPPSAAAHFPKLEMWTKGDFEAFKNVKSWWRTFFAFSITSAEFWKAWGSIGRFSIVILRRSFSQDNSLHCSLSANMFNSRSTIVFFSSQSCSSEILRASYIEATLSEIFLILSLSVSSSSSRD